MIPIVATLLANGLNILGKAVLAKGQDVIEEKLGVKLNDNPSDEDLLKLKQLEIEHEEFLITSGLEEKNIDAALTKDYLASDDSARKMQVAALGQSDIFSKRFIYYLATGWSIVAAIYVFLVTFVSIPPANMRMADTVLGFLLGTIISQLMAFFFGSSARSQSKDDVIKKLASGDTQ